MTKPVHSQEAFCRNHGRCLAGAGRSWSRDICFFQPASHCLHALLCCPDQQAAAMDLYGQGLQVLRGASQAQSLPTCSLPRAQWTTRAERVPKRVSCAAAAPPEAPSKPAKVDRQPAIPTIRQLANRRGMCVSRVRASWQSTQLHLRTCNTYLQHTVESLSGSARAEQYWFGYVIELASPAVDALGQ